MIQTKKRDEILKILAQLYFGHVDFEDLDYPEEEIEDFSEELESNLYNLNKEDRKHYVTELLRNINLIRDPGRKAKFYEMHTMILTELNPIIEGVIDLFGIKLLDIEEAKNTKIKTLRDFFKDDSGYTKAIDAMSNIKLFNEGGKRSFYGKGRKMVTVFVALLEKGLLREAISKEPFVMAFAKHYKTSISKAGISQAHLDDDLRKKLLALLAK